MTATSPTSRDRTRFQPSLARALIPCPPRDFVANYRYNYYYYNIHSHINRKREDAPLTD